MPEIQAFVWFRSIRSFYLVLVITVHPHVKACVAVSALFLDHNTIRYPRINIMESLITRDPYVHFSRLLVKPLLLINTALLIVGGLLNRF